MGWLLVLFGEGRHGTQSVASVFWNVADDVVGAADFESVATLYVLKNGGIEVDDEIDAGERAAEHVLTGLVDMHQTGNGRTARCRSVRRFDGPEIGVIEGGHVIGSEEHRLLGGLLFCRVGFRLAAGYDASLEQR